MKEREMNDKSIDEAAKLSPEQEAWLDRELGSESQSNVAQMVRALPEEEPEHGWRSELSGRLFQVAQQRERRRKIAWTLRPAFGLGAAAMLAVVLMYKESPMEQPSSPNLEAQVLNVHREAVQLGTFWGSVRADEEARTASAPMPSEYRWDETDLSTL